MPQQAGEGETNTHKAMIPLIPVPLAPALVGSPFRLPYPTLLNTGSVGRGKWLRFVPAHEACTTCRHRKRTVSGECAGPVSSIEGLVVGGACSPICTRCWWKRSGWLHTGHLLLAGEKALELELMYGESGRRVPPRGRPPPCLRPRSSASSAQSPSKIVLHPSNSSICRWKS